MKDLDHLRGQHSMGRADVLREHYNVTPNPLYRNLANDAELLSTLAGDVVTAHFAPVPDENYDRQHRLWLGIVGALVYACNNDKERAIALVAERDHDLAAIVREVLYT
jgi:hypothetical protein